MALLIHDIPLALTGNDASGKAIVLTDEKEAPNQFEPPMRDGVHVNNIWRVREHPHVLEAGDGLSALETAPAGERIPLAPPTDGSVFRVISFSPEADWIEKVERHRRLREESFAAMEAEALEDEEREAKQKAAGGAGGGGGGGGGGGAKDEL